MDICHGTPRPEAEISGPMGPRHRRMARGDRSELGPLLRFTRGTCQAIAQRGAFAAQSGVCCSNATYPRRSPMRVWAKPLRTRKSSSRDALAVSDEQHTTAFILGHLAGDVLRLRRHLSARELEALDIAAEIEAQAIARIGIDECNLIGQCRQLRSEIVRKRAVINRHVEKRR